MNFIEHMKKSAEQNAKDLQDIPNNWESLQDADQSELERIELMRDELKRDEPVEEESEARQYCFSLRDTL